MGINKRVNDKNLETKLVRGGTSRSNFGETSEAIFLNSGFCYDNAETAEKRFNKEELGFVYSRYSNPTLRSLEERMTLLEEGAEECCVVSSGMAAVFAAIMSKIKSGDHIIANKVLFGSCYHIITEILPKFNVEVTLVSGDNLTEWRENFKKNTRVVFIETPANPNLELTDIQAVAQLAKKNGAFLIVDNVFATPLGQSPLTLGADCVIYSTTKHLDGQGRTLGGAILGYKNFIEDTLLPFVRHTGPALSPFNAWVILKALETFSLRFKKHCKSALKIAEFLDSHPKITNVFYPHLKNHPQYKLSKKQMKKGSNIIAFSIKGNKKDAFNFMNKLKIIDISNNLGDSKSLITHPASSTHSNIEPTQRKAMGISDELLRVSIGLEDTQDLIADLKQSLE